MFRQRHQAPSDAEQEFGRPALGRPHRLRRAITHATIGLAVIAAGSMAATPAQAAGNTLTVNVGKTVRPVTHVAAGGLYGVDEGETTPSLSRLYPLRPNTFTQPPPGTQQLGNGATTPCCDGLKVADKITKAGAQQYLRLPDIFSRFPYNWVSWSDWESKIGTMIKARMDAKSTTNIAGYEIWNEPDWTWEGQLDDTEGTFHDMWTRSYRAIRAVDTKTPIVGPGTASYNHNWMYAFMQHAKATNTLPGVAVWHQLGTNSGWQTVKANIDDFRAIETSLGLPHRPVSINEYGSTSQVDQPSVAVHYMAEFERAGVHDAERAYWYEAGTMNGLLYNNQPTASYWAYKWYGDQSGNIVETVPQSWLDGVGSYDAARKQVNVVFGGDSGDNKVKINGVGALGSQVSVKLSRTNNTGRHTNQAAPVTVSTANYTVAADGSITVPVSGMDAVMAYQLLVTPTSGAPAWQQTYEAENATVVNAGTFSSTSASNGSYVGRIDNTGDMRDQSFVDFLVEVPSARTYTMTIKYANATGTNATQGLAYNGGAWSTVTYPPTSSGWGKPTGTATVDVNLRAGYNTIRLAKGSPYFAGGVGYAELDNITLQ
ncbi:CBM35 domain-containing protein [Streptomyces sp. NPDC052299]|uniref:CBM35 domain-containing protein n=1 Tax=Streptomyces sp. NPDC052299 TaxID=3155054 RepID=UPI00342A2C96